MTSWPFRIIAGLLTLLTWGQSCPAELKADNLILLVNRNVRVGAELAEHYARVRGVPDNRIVALNLPAAAEEISFADYESQVVLPLRQFLRDHHLESKVTCAVTFYGLPIRITKRPQTPEMTAELAQVRREVQVAEANLRDVVGELEKLARTVNDRYASVASDLPGTAEGAMKFISVNLGGIVDLQRRQQAQQAMLAIFQKLTGSAGLVGHLGVQPNATPEAIQSLAKLRLESQTAQREIAALRDHRSDPAARARMRELVGGHFGLFQLVGLLNAQAAYLRPADTASALDSELSLLWVDYYPLAGFQNNPLNRRIDSALTGGASPDSPPPALMVMRLDAASLQRVRSIIDTSIEVERTGLLGQVVIDSRGIAATKTDGKPDGYGSYDQTLRNLDRLLEDKTHLKVLFDTRPTTLPANSASDVALYCGWYSLRKYIPSMTFSPGAVAFHVASFEMVSLHDPRERGWVRNLLEAGAVSTAGSVAEPYLTAFPPADEFFPLLLTGRVTLAEAYWKTTPWTSWQMSFIGDPLYRPYATNPALDPSELPAELGRVASSPPAAATAPEPVNGP